MQLPTRLVYVRATGAQVLINETDFNPDLHDIAPPVPAKQPDDPNGGQDDDGEQESAKPRRQRKGAK